MWKSDFSFLTALKESLFHIKSEKKWIWVTLGK